MKPVGHLQHLRARALAVPLLLEHPVDLGAGERQGHQAVAERLDGERLAVGDVARVDVGPDAARVHERDHGVAEAARRGGRELGVGDDVAEDRLAGRVLLARERRRRGADAAVGDRGRDGRVLVEDRRLGRVLGHVLGDDLVVGRDRDDLAGAPVDAQVGVGQHAPERRRARGALAGDHAVVGLVRVAGEVEVDLLARAPDDVGQRAHRVDAVVDLPEVDGVALVHEHDDRAHALLLEDGRVLVDRVGLVAEREALDARGGDDRRRVLQHDADEADLHAADAADLVGAEERLARCRRRSRWRPGSRSPPRRSRRRPGSRRPGGSRRPACAAARPSPRRTRGCPPS